MKSSSMDHIGLSEKKKKGARVNILKASGWEFFKTGWKSGSGSKIRSHKAKVDTQN